MGTALTGNTPASTYNALLKTTANTAVDATLRTVSDGLGNDSALQVSTTGVKSLGTFDATGAATVGGTLAVTGATTLASASTTGGDHVADRFAATPSTLTYAGTTTIDFSSAVKTCQTLTLTGNVTLATSNLTAGAAKKIRVVASGGPWTIAVPGTWLNLNGSVPTSIASGKTGVLSLFSWSTTDASVEASFAVVP